MRALVSLFPVWSRATQRAGVLKRVRSAQEGAVQAHQHLPPGKVDEQQGQENLQGELLIMDGAFDAPFLGFGGAGPREVRTEVSVVDTLRGDHRQDEVDDALERVHPQEGHAGFEMLGEFGSLSAGGFWRGHTFKTPPVAVLVEGQCGTPGICRLGRQKTEVVSY